ncbi:MAG TPA: hypothetical protein PLL32_07335 [Anaeromyxobacteraceae bacterium]|nr:hypothetical protein [Anaeromyxobacteraceae bacterium]
MFEEPDTAAVKDWLFPGWSVTLFGLTVTATCVGAVTVIVAEALLVESATEVATTWKVPAPDGAVYAPADVTEPPDAPSRTDQVTRVTALPVTAAVNVLLVSGAICAAGGVTVTTVEVAAPPGSDGPLLVAAPPHAVTRTAKAAARFRRWVWGICFL